MRKRKRGLDHTKNPISDSTHHVPVEDLQSQQRFSEPNESNAARSIPATNESSDHSHFSDQPKLSKHSRYPFGRSFSRKSSPIHSDASPSYSNAKFSFKSENKNLFEGLRDRTLFVKPERIRSRSITQNGVSGDTKKMECGICQKHLKKNPSFVSMSSNSSNDLSVVAVLSCGHTYHAECLEVKTSIEHKHDPLCPLCLNQTSS